MSDAAEIGRKKLAQVHVPSQPDCGLLAHGFKASKRGSVPSNLAWTRRRISGSHPEGKMFRYLLVLGGAGLVIYAAQHPELLGLLDQGPDFKVWVNQTHIPPNNSPFDILNVQSREEKPLIVRRVLMHDDPKCVNMDASMTYHAETPVKLGEVLRFGLGLHGFNACSPVQVLISTDRGDSIYHFN